MTAVGFKYRLQPLLDTKLRLKTDAEQRAAEAQRLARAAQRLLEEREARVRDLEQRRLDFRSRMLNGTAGPVSGREATIGRDYLRGLGEAIEGARDAAFSQKLAVEEALERLSAARRELADRARDVEILEKHRDRLEQRFRRDAERKEAVELDEIGNMLYLRGRRAI
jgi:flagellar export protein FliJ